MRVMPIVIGILVVGTFLVAVAPTSTAAAYCVRKVKEPFPYDNCDGLVCIGHNSQTGWQTCVPPRMDCLYDNCCSYEVGGQTYYYCPPPA